MAEGGWRCRLLSDGPRVTFAIAPDVPEAAPVTRLATLTSGPVETRSLAAVLLCSALSLAATPANIAPANIARGSVMSAAYRATPAPPWTCTNHVQPTQVQGTAMSVNGLQVCSGDPGWRLQRVIVTIEKQLWPAWIGRWETMGTTDSGDINEESVERTAFYDCKGTGTNTFRGRVEGMAGNGLYSSSAYTSSQATINCGPPR